MKRVIKLYRKFRNWKATPGEVLAMMAGGMMLPFLFLFIIKLWMMPSELRLMRQAIEKDRAAEAARSK